MKLKIFTTFFLVSIQLSFGQFITTWETTSNNQSIIIPTNSVYTYDYDIDWGDGTTSTNQNGNAQHTYTDQGIYTVSITGAFPAIFFNVVGPFNPTLNTNRTRIKTIQQWGNNNWLSMNNAFSGCTFLTVTATDNPNLSQVTDMSLMFYRTQNLTVDASTWNVSNVTLMPSLFNEADNFNSDISNWDVSNVTNMSRMFSEAGNFNQDIGNWDVSNVTNMSRMFYQASIFNQDLNNWNTSSVTDMSGIFNRAFIFNQPLNNWDVSNVTNMSEMFEQAFAFNQNIENWNVGNVTDMYGMFLRSPVFNQPIGNWDVSNVTDMEDMFRETIFNQDIINWVTGNVTTMSSMFRDNNIFNQPIGNWDVSNVTDMSLMFLDASSFNQDISSWNVSNVTDMSTMFRDAILFNQDIGNWNVSNVTNMAFMFDDAFAFNQNLGNWNISNVDDMFGMLSNTMLSVTNYDATLIGWAAQTVNSEISLSADSLIYCNSNTARTILTSAPNNWSITDDQLDCGSLPTINIPDPNFEQALIDQNIDSDGIINGQVPQLDIMDVEFLNVSANNISDLTGIEAFTSLETLLASGNNLINIDVSNNTNLSGLYIGMNALESIDVSNNSALLALALGANQLTSIDLSNNQLLTQLFLQDNQLTSIDVSNLDLLAEFNVSENNLNELDLSENSLLTQIYCSGNDLFNLNVQNGNNSAVIDSDFNASLNANLGCIQVDNLTYSNDNWNSIDTQSSFSVDCAPDNDDCFEAGTLDLGTVISGTTFGSTSSNSFPSCQEDTIVLLDVWYQFTAPSSGAITAVATSILNNLNINMAIYDDCNDVEPISCDSGTIEVTDLIPGQTYFIQIWVGGNISGRSNSNSNLVDNFTLNVQDTSTLSNTSFTGSENNLKLYPNPAKDEITISSNKRIDSYQILDVTGKIVLSNSQIQSLNYSIDVNSLSMGIYLIKIKTENSSVIKNLLIK